MLKFQLFSLIEFRNNIINHLLFSYNNNNEITIYDLKEYNFKSINSIVNKIVNCQKDLKYFIRIFTNITQNNYFWDKLNNQLKIHHSYLEKINIEYSKDLSTIPNFYLFFEKLKDINIDKNCKNNFEETYHYLVDQHPNTYDYDRGLCKILAQIPTVINKYFRYKNQPIKNYKEDCFKDFIDDDLPISEEKIFEENIQELIGMFTGNDIDKYFN